MLDLIILLYGISGVIAIALNFYLEATDKFSQNHRAFAFINFYGSLALLIYSIYNQVWLFVVLNSFLILVGLLGLWKVLTSSTPLKKKQYF